MRLFINIIIFNITRLIYRLTAIILQSKSILMRFDTSSQHNLNMLNKIITQNLNHIIIIHSSTLYFLLETKLVSLLLRTIKKSGDSELINVNA